jgi:hypothetical protein
MKSLKIGVLTFHRCINYGSYWQARSLAEGLRFRGHDAVILDHYSPRINIAEWKCAYQPVLPTPVPAADRSLYREKIKGFFRAFESLPLSTRFSLHNPTEMEHYDLVVVGSDEVWNLFHPWYGRHPFFYGEGIRADRLISYAASFGNYDAAWQLEKRWAERLQNFSCISVRDANSQEIVQDALGYLPQMVLDPCLQFTVEPEQRDNKKFERPYAAVYGHNFSRSFISQIKSWAGERKLPLISIGYRNDWADEQWITADPHDFAHFISHTEALVTNFFHGCVFALRNAKPFVCETSPYRGNKLQGLMAKIGGEKYLLKEDTPADIYKERLNNQLDEVILKKIDRLRQTSNEWLDQALAVKQFSLA